MTNEREPQDGLRDLAEKAMDEKQDETGNAAQTRELWDLPAEPDSVLVELQQHEDE